MFCDAENLPCLGSREAGTKRRAAEALKGPLAVALRVIMRAGSRLDLNLWPSHTGQNGSDKTGRTLDVELSWAAV